MVLDVGALSAINASNCIPTAKVAYASQYLTPDQLSKYYPYYLQLLGVPVTDLRNSVLGMNQLGYFKASKGFKKLGVLYDTCNPALIVAERAALKEAGVPKSKIIEFNLGCPAGQTFTQSILQPAVLAFKNAGVTDVTVSGSRHLNRHIHPGSGTAELQAPVSPCERHRRSPERHGHRRAGLGEPERGRERDVAGLR